MPREDDPHRRVARAVGGGDDALRIMEPFEGAEDVADEVPCDATSDPASEAESTAFGVSTDIDPG